MKQPDHKLHVCDVEDDCVFYTDFRAVMDPQEISSPKSDKTSRRPVWSPSKTSSTKEKAAEVSNQPPPFMPLKEACREYNEFQETVSYWDIE